MAIQLGPATRGAVLCACFVTMIILNVLSVSLPLGRKTNSEIANANPVRACLAWQLFAPPGRPRASPGAVLDLIC